MGQKSFPRPAAYAVNRITGEVGVIQQYPQLVGQQEADQQSAGGANLISSLDWQAAEFHTLKSDGTTAAEYRNVPIRDLRIAKVSEIPAKRRPSEAQARKFGYPLK